MHRCGQVDSYRGITTADELLTYENCLSLSLKILFRVKHRQYLSGSLLFRALNPKMGQYPTRERKLNKQKHSLA